MKLDDIQLSVDGNDFFLEFTLFQGLVMSYFCLNVFKKENERKKNE